MRQVRNPLLDICPSHEIVATPHARYQLDEHHISIPDVKRILWGSNSVWGDVKPDGRTQYVSRIFDNEQGEINLVWEVENDRRINIIGAFVGRLAF